VKRALLLIGLTSLAYGDFGKASRGTTAANFLKLSVDARSAGMGEAYGAMADDASALYWNPAGMTRIDAQAVTLTHAPYLASSFYDYAAYATRAGRHAFGGGVQYFSAGSIPQRDENNTDLGTFTPNDLALLAGYAYQLTEAGDSVGVTGKYIRSKILDTASTFALDAGVQSRLYAERVRLSFSAANIGGTLKYEDIAENLPLSFRAGSAWRLTSQWDASLDVILPRDNDAAIAAGTEYRWQALPGMTLASRAGFNSGREGAGLALGFGLGFQQMSFDYAFQTLGSLGFTHRISMALRFGEGSEGRVGLQDTVTPR